MANAVITHFFHAIVHLGLTVSICPAAGQSIDINKDTIARLFQDRRGTRRFADSHYFYRAILAKPAAVTGTPVPLGPLAVYVLREAEAPRRTAYVNRNGMLITADKQKRTNPLHTASGHRPDFAAVVIADTDDGDSYIRSLEGPAHDELLLTRHEGEDLAAVEKVFESARMAVGEIIDNATLVIQAQRSNVEELRSTFPDELDDRQVGNVNLKGKQMKAHAYDDPISVDTVTVDRDGDDRQEADLERKGNRRRKKPKGREDKPASVQTRVPMKDIDILRKDSRTLLMAFTPAAPGAPLRFRLQARGLDYIPGEPCLSLESVEARSGNPLCLDHTPDTIEITPGSGNRIVLVLTGTQPLEHTGYAVHFPVRQEGQE